MNLVIRQAINRHAHQQGIQHAAALKQRMMAFAAELLEEGADNETVLKRLGIPSHNESSESTEHQGWAHCIIE